MSKHEVKTTMEVVEDEMGSPPVVSPLSADTDAAAVAIKEISRARPMIRNWKRVVAGLRTIT